MTALFRSAVRCCIVAGLLVVLAACLPSAESRDGVKKNEAY